VGKRSRVAAAGQRSAATPLRLRRCALRNCGTIEMLIECRSGSERARLAAALPARASGNSRALYGSRRGASRWSVPAAEPAIGDVSPAELAAEFHQLRELAPRLRGPHAPPVDRARRDGSNWMRRPGDAPLRRTVAQGSSQASLRLAGPFSLLPGPCRILRSAQFHQRAGGRPSRRGPRSFGTMRSLSRSPHRIRRPSVSSSKQVIGIAG